MSIPSKFEADREIVVQALALFEKKTPAEMAELEKVDPLVQARHAIGRLMTTSLLADVVELTKREAELERIRGQVLEVEKMCDKRLAELAESIADLTNKNVELTAEAERQRELAAAKNTPAEIEEAWTKGLSGASLSTCPFEADTVEARWWNRGQTLALTDRRVEEAHNKGARAAKDQIEQDWTAGGNAADSHDRVDKWFLRGLAHKNAKAIAKRERKFDEELKKALRSRELELESAWRAGYTRETTEAPLPYPEGSEEERWFNRGADGRRTERLASAHEADMKSLATILRTKDGAFSFAAVVEKIEELRSAKPTRPDVVPPPTHYDVNRVVKAMQSAVDNMKITLLTVMGGTNTHKQQLHDHDALWVRQWTAAARAAINAFVEMNQPTTIQKSAIMVDSEKLYDATRTEDGEQWAAEARTSLDFDDMPSPPRLEVREGYHALAKILDFALDQAQFGKGRERHGQQAEWTEQKIFQIPLLQGHAGGLVYQIAKKATESEHMDDPEAQFREALGVVVYAAALAHYYREEMKQ